MRYLFSKIEKYLEVLEKLVIIATNSIVAYLISKIYILVYD